MKQRTDIEKKIQEALESLDNIRRAVPQLYFYTRLKARIEKEKNSWGEIAGFISRPVYAFAMVCVVLFVNAWILYNNDGEITKGSNSSQAISADVPDEYNLAVNTFYDYETP